MKKVKIGVVGVYRREFDKKFTQIDKEGMEWMIELINVIQEEYRDIVSFVCKYDFDSEDYLVSSCMNEATRICEKLKRESVDALLVLNLDFGDQRSVFKICNVLKTPVMLVGNREKSERFSNPETDSICGTLMITSMLKKNNIKYWFAGLRGIDDVKSRIKEYVMGTFCIRNLSESILCAIGNCPNNFNIMEVDHEVISKVFNINIEKYSWNSFLKKYEGDVESKEKLFKIVSEYQSFSMLEKYIEKVERYYNSVINYHKESDAYCFAVDCWNDATEEVSYNICAINSLLMDKGFCISCENDILSAITMRILQLCGNSKKVTVLDISNVLIEDNLFLLWHCGNCCFNMLDNDKIIVGYRNDNEPRSYGLIQGGIKQGNVTFSSLCCIEGKIKLLVGTGKVVKIENNIKGTYAFMNVDNVYDTYMKFVSEGATQHICLVEGKCLNTIKIMAHFYGIPIVDV